MQMIMNGYTDAKRLRMNAHWVIDARPAAQILILRKANVTTAVIGGFIRQKEIYERQQSNVYKQFR